MNENFSFDDRERGVMSVIVRGTGLFLLVVGLIVGLLTIREALLLYANPARVERFAVAIEKGSNIDKSLTSLRDSSLTGAGDDDTASSTATAQDSTRNSSDIRVSYFLSWVIVLLLLLLIARIALAAIKTGGELVLYDMQVKQLARMLIKESGSSTRR